jgi:hypothetical protein
VSQSRLLRYAAIGAGAAVVIAVGVAAFLSLQTTFQPATTNPGSTPCTPQPCANVRGYILWVSDVKVDGGVVTMQLTFRNSSPATHADPADLQLIDRQGNSVTAAYDAPGCTHWPRTDFNNGAQFGPVSECFRPSTTDPPLKLHWEPDMGLFCCETTITLES